MKKLIVPFLTIAIIILACSDKQESVKLEAGTPEYALAQKISAKVTSLNPDENKVIVKANDFDITSGEVIKVLYSRIGNNEARLVNQSEEQLKQIVVQNAERIAEQKLLVIAAEKAGYAVSDSELDSTLNQRYQRFGGIDKYKERLESSGIKFATMREDMRQGLMIRNYLEKDVAATENVSDEELQKYYDEKYTGDRTATVQHILLMTQGKSEADKQEVKKKAEGILAEAKSGKDFGELAQKYSEDPGSKDRGGLYENFERGQMVKPFEDASFNLPIGSISDLVETQYGYHIIKVISRQKGNESLDQVRPKLLEEMKRQKIDDYIKEVRESAGIEVVGLG
jgi:peptidyl-prolyl cis-trans isomerase C